MQSLQKNIEASQEKLVGEGCRARIRMHFFHRTIWHIQTKAYDKPIKAKQNKTNTYSSQ